MSDYRAAIPLDLRLIQGSEQLPNGCVVWRKPRADEGYGRISVGGKHLRVHVVAFELFHGPVPEGHQVDHTCHNADPTCTGGPTCKHRACINPLHLEAVTQDENKRRGRSGDHWATRWAARTHCSKGHELNEANTFIERTGRRRCRECQRAAGRASNQRRQAQRTTTGAP